jgi:ABC-type multidrug transport system fused ATPase/permease subunit
VLADLSFRIQPGESVAIVGATGSGKSTMVSLLCGLVQPSAGRVLLGGVDVADLGSDGAAGIVAPVLQETFLFADTVRDNLTLGSDVTDDEVDAALAIVAADVFVGELPDGIDTVVGERGATLSGGQRQRLAIARALLRSPRVLVLDDSTSAVDPTIEAGILRNLRVDQGAVRGGSEAAVPTLMVIAHRLATIRMADRVLFLEGGSIAASGSHEELLDVPAYAALARAYEEAGL